MAADEAEILWGAVRSRLPGADESTARIVGAIAGLLGAMAYADGKFSPAEAVHLRAELGRIHGLDAPGVQAIAQLLEQHVVRFSTAFVPRFTRALREETDRDFRIEVLDVLLGMAAADGSITSNEVTVLRTTTQALGLDQADYNELQSRHRDKLSFL